MRRSFAAIDDQNVAIVDVSDTAGHRNTARTHEKGRVRLVDTQFIEVDYPVEVIIGWRRKAGAHPRGRKWDQHAPAWPYPKPADD